MNQIQQEMIDGAVYAEELIGVVQLYKRSWLYGQWEMMAAVAKDNVV